MENNRIFMKNLYVFFIFLISASLGCSSEDDSSLASQAGGNQGGYYASTPGEKETPAQIDPVTGEKLNYFYFSYDDSASTAGVELCKYRISNKILPDTNLARPWEFLNYESFNHINQVNIGLFDISLGLWESKDPKNLQNPKYDLGVHISAPTLETSSRKNAIITLIVDVSGSMEESLIFDSGNGSVKTLLEAAKYGIKEMYKNLKDGDIINIVQFSTTASIVLENYNYASGNEPYLNAVNSLKTIASTNLDAGIKLGYDLAIKHYNAGKINRVIILTDAYANTGQVDPAIISQNTRINNNEGIYFSGLGFGPNFQEAFLNELTEKGKGAYYAIITPQDAKRAFSTRFMALLNIAAKDIIFRLDFPASMQRISSAAEESSTVKEDVSTTNFSYNTSQFFLEGFQLKSGAMLDKSQAFKLTIEYLDPVSLEKKTVIFEKSISDILEKDLENIKDAHLVSLLARLIRGETSKDEANMDLENNFSGYSSPKAFEYRSLIQSWMTLETGN